MSYQIVEHEGKAARLYDNGDLRDERGRLLARPQRIEATMFTPENAVAMAKRRKEKILEAVEAGIMKATDAPNPAEAISMLIEKRMRVAMSDDGRTGNEATRIVLDALDAYQDKRQETVQVQRNEYVIDEETRKMLTDIISNRDVIEGTVTDAE